MKNIVIIGNGISGVTAARHIRKRSDHSITIISAESDHFYSRTALMYIFMGHMRYEHTKPYEDRFWEKNRITLLRDYVEKVDTDQKRLLLRTGKVQPYDVLILAVGSTYNRFGWPGQDLQGVQGLINLQDLELMEQNTKGIRKAVIVGGGLIGIEMAEMLQTRNVHVTMLIREGNYWANVLPAPEARMVNRHIREHGVDLRLATELQAIKAGPDQKVTGIVTTAGEEIECQFVGLTIGVRPNIFFLEGSKIKTDTGILVNKYFETNIPEVYAIGDCAQFEEAPAGRRKIEQVWYTGRMHGETLALTICGNKTAYNSGPWFNSAKFFNLEYQVYGQVQPREAEDGEHLYWEHESGQKAVRIIYRKADGVVTGINLLGIRYRHEVCDRWLQSNATIQQVLSELKAANFDPEFYRKHEGEIMSEYKGTLQPQVKKRKKLFGLF
ncbi:NAD(P)/FAD-dependent oxidoreductase [Pontibacter pamirensis]|uniref:NAD(P)/FAD-dependent oxidoreductase n=1 Tax=Pontibacter pamirensis TaxID=2562824 RepID=UPI00138A1C3E|nr:FAD-dependent oxidoreductase [Pontibacter pamirensis]